MYIRHCMENQSRTTFCRECCNLQPLDMINSRLVCKSHIIRMHSFCCSHSHSVMSEMSFIIHPEARSWVRHIPSKKLGSESIRRFRSRFGSDGSSSARVPSWSALGANIANPSPSAPCSHWSAAWEPTKWQRCP